MGAWARGRLLMAGVTPKTDLSDALDLLTVIMFETPEVRDNLRKWRQGLDRADVAARAKAGVLNRAEWGLRPHQIEQQRLAMERLGRGG
ncbi:MAG: hypothetical protein ACRDTT_00420 [Pseudonocardiaceae bacterium]